MACRPEAPQGPHVVDVAATDASAIVVVDSGAVANADAAAESRHPPTGTYEVTARVVSDNCRPKYRSPEPWKTVVQASAEGEIAKVNIFLSAIPPSNATSAHERSDLSVEPRRETTRTTTPMPACPSYTSAQTMTITEAGPQGFTVAITVQHGDGKACSSLPPSKCTTRVEHVYRVIEALCPARCTRGLVFGRGIGGPNVDCRCP